MQIDYGKQAYAKLKEFERRIENLEFKIKSLAYNEIEFDLGSLEVKPTHENKIKFISFKEGSIKISASVKIKEGATVIIKGQSNGVPFISGEFTSEYAFDEEITVKQGENQIELTLYAGEKITISEFKVTVKGAVEPEEKHSRVTVTPCGSDNYVLHKSGEVSTFYVQNSSAFKSVFSYQNLSDCALCGVYGSNYCILVITEDGRLEARVLQVGTHYGSYYDLGVHGATSVAGYSTENGFVVLFIKLNKLYSGTFVPGKAFTYQETGVTGNRVYADNLAPSTCVVTSLQGAKLCVFESSLLRYAFGEGENFHLKQFETHVEVCYLKKGVLKMRKIIGGVMSAEQEVGFMHEKAYLPSGAILRTKDRLTISEE